MPLPFAKALVGMTMFGGAIESKKRRLEAQKAQAMLRNGHAKYSPYARDYDPNNGPYTDRHGLPLLQGGPKNMRLYSDQVIQPTLGYLIAVVLRDRGSRRPAIQVQSSRVLA